MTSIPWVAEVFYSGSSEPQEVPFHSGCESLEELSISLNQALDHSEEIIMVTDLNTKEITLLNLKHISRINFYKDIDLG